MRVCGGGGETRARDEKRKKGPTFSPILVDQKFSSYLRCTFVFFVFLVVVCECVCAFWGSARRTARRVRRRRALLFAPRPNPRPFPCPHLLIALVDVGDERRHLLGALQRRHGAAASDVRDPADPLLLLLARDAHQRALSEAHIRHKGLVFFIVALESTLRGGGVCARNFRRENAFFLLATTHPARFVSLTRARGAR